MSLIILHKNKDQQYSFFNCPEGPERVAALGANAADFDINVTGDDDFVVTHWPRPLKHEGYYDPKDIVRPNCPVELMHSSEVQRLMHPQGNFIRLACWHAALCFQVGVIPCFEVKSWTRLALLSLKKDLGSKYRDVVIMGLPKQRKALQFAHQLGFKTLLLSRGPVITSRWSFLTYVKAPRFINANLVRHGVKRIGTSPRNATRWGCGAHPGNVPTVKRAVERAKR